MSTTFTLRVFHPALSAREVSEAFGLPGTGRGTWWETPLAGDETGRGGTDAALADIAARLAHYRYFVDDIRNTGGRVEIAVAGGGDIDAPVADMFRTLNIPLVFKA
jgi:long-subunit acyl-CoA synthetase (AMP-forming)